MEAFRDLLIARTGHPRHGAVAQAARDSGVAQSLLSKYMDPGNEVRPEPPTLEKLADYLNRDYDELLLMVWGKSGKPKRREPVTPHDLALRSVDVMAAAIGDLRVSLTAMAPTSQPRNGSGKKRSSTQHTGDYSYQTSVPMGHPADRPKITRLSDWQRQPQAA